MPEHVHLLVTEPDRSNLATAIQALKQSVAQKLIGHHGRFWQTRYYDFNVCSPEKRMEKLKYIHRNPVTRGLVETPNTGGGAAIATTPRASRSRLRLSHRGWLIYQHPSADPDRLSELFGKS